MKIKKIKEKSYYPRSLISRKSFDYKTFSKEELILRDHLAIDRTAMANEVSFLAYIRTALTILVGGVSLLHFFSDYLFHILGWVAIGVSIITIIIGFVRFKQMGRLISEIRDQKN